MNSQQNHALRIYFSRKPEFEQAFIFFPQNFPAPLPRTAPLLGHACSVVFIHHLFQSRFLDLAGQEPLCGARQRVVPAPSLRKAPAPRPPAELGLPRWVRVQALSAFALRAGSRAGGPLPAVLYNKHGSGAALCWEQRGIYGMRASNSIRHLSAGKVGSDVLEKPQAAQGGVAQDLAPEHPMLWPP